MSNQTDKNNIILSNQEFLTAIFGEQLVAGHAAWVCSFVEDPRVGRWKGQAWNSKTEHDSFAEETYTHNCFFSLACFRSAEKGRRLGNVAAAVAVILDDIGTKASEKDLPRPTWAIETSPGNFQYGYAFSPAITDMQMAKNFFQKLAEDQGITDTGGQNVARYARLPRAHHPGTGGDISTVLL